MPVTGTIVPTHVGVNRQQQGAKPQKMNCPHSCGGEPMSQRRNVAPNMIVPTHVGVNRKIRASLKLELILSPLMWG